MAGKSAPLGRLLPPLLRYRNIRIVRMEAQLPVADRARQTHRPAVEFLDPLGVQMDRFEVFEPRKRRAVLPPPRARGFEVVGVDDDPLASPARLAQPLLVHLPQVDPQRDVPAVVLFPQVRLVLPPDPLGDDEAVRCVEGEGGDAHHQPLVGLGGVLGDREVMGLVVVAVHIADIELDFADRRTGGHRCSLDKTELWHNGA